MVDAGPLASRSDELQLKACSISIKNPSRWGFPFPRKYHSSGSYLDVNTEINDPESDAYKLYHLSQLYVSNLPSEATWHDVKDFMQQRVQPKVRYVHLLTTVDGTSRRCAFVKFESHEEAQIALKSLQNVEWDENMLGVKLKRIPTPPSQQSSLENLSSTSDDSKNSNRIFVGNLPFRSTWQDLKQFMESQRDGIKINDGCYMFGPDGRPRGYAIVQLATPEDTRQAMEMHDLVFKGRPLLVREDRERAPRTFSSESHPDCFLYLYNLNSNVTLQDLRGWVHSSLCDTTRSQVMHVRLFQGKSSSQKNAVVGFSSNEYAQKALSVWNGMELMGTPVGVREYRSEPQKGKKVEDEIDAMLGRLESLE